MDDKTKKIMQRTKDRLIESFILLIISALILICIELIFGDTAFHILDFIFNL